METDVHTQGRESHRDQSTRVHWRSGQHASVGRPIRWRCRQGRPGRGHQQGQLVRWKKTMSTYIELDAFKAESGATDVSLSIASVADKHRTLKLTSLVNSSPTRSTRLRLCWTTAFSSRSRRTCAIETEVHTTSPESTMSRTRNRSTT